MTVGILEDHVMFREVLRKVCTTELGCTVVFETGSATEGVSQIRSTIPQIIVLDLVLNDGNGFNVLDMIADVRPLMHVLVLSSYCDDYTVYRVEQAGVDGFLDKGTDAIGELRAAFESIESGCRYFGERFREVRVSRIVDPNAFSKLLSAREQRFVAACGQGLNDDQISHRLSISKRTVQTYRYTISRKLGLATPMALVHYSMEHGFSRYG